jgi:hypothetical protein
MGWTLADVWDLPVHYYDFLVAELTDEAAKSRR